MNKQNKYVRAAQRALLYEAVLWPKPGLVDPVNQGSHPDMDIFTFVDSSLALESYFEAIVTLAENFKGVDLTQLFAQARKLGIEAETEMLEATKGVNTHKGAIFSLGILVLATAYAGTELEIISKTVQVMLEGLTKSDFEKLSFPGTSLSAGERQFLDYGLKGIRGEAEAGFPIVIQEALPLLRQSKGGLKQRLLDCFMFIAAHLPDSTLVKRAGNLEVLDWMKDQSRSYFQVGNRQEFLLQLDQEMTEKNLSLGGCADLLVLTIYLGILEGII